MCNCPFPRPELHTPSGRLNCLSCARPVDGPWVLNDDRMQEFFDYLRMFPKPEAASAAEDHCKARERAGRVKFGFRYLQRDNAAEALEEAADGINYCLMEQLRYEREGGDMYAKGDLYEAAHHFALAYRALLHARARRRGAP